MHKDAERFHSVDLGHGDNYKIVRSGRDLVVDGFCKRCEAASKFIIKDGVAIGGSGKGLGGRKKPNLPEATVYCQCGFVSRRGRRRGGMRATWKVALGL